MKPLISIILPAYNGAKFIARAIQSAIDQDYDHFELLIINDGSKDDTEEVIAKFLGDTRVRYIKNEVNLGLQKTLNVGIHRAVGEFIARLDQDDVWTDRSKLSKQLEFMTANKDYVLVGTDATIVDPEGREIGSYRMPKTDSQIRSRILSKNCFLHASIMARIDAVKRAGLYGEGEDTYCIEDYDLWTRMGMVGKLANMDFKGLTITVHPDSITARNRVRQARKFLSIAWKHIGDYPNAFFGLFTATLRLIFFKLVSIFPISGKLVYKLQVFYKSR